MNLDTPLDIKIFLGDSLQEPSEIQFLERLRLDLIKQKRGALIFANFYAGRFKQQIDFMVITSTCASVVELKNYTAPIVGDLNGPWKLNKTDGTLIKVLDERNPYTQALNAKYAISGEMETLVTNGSDFPSLPQNKKYFTTIESVVCIFPEIPKGSAVTSGNYKTYVKGYPDFLRFIFTNNTNPRWSEKEWLKLVMQLNLRYHDFSEVAHPKQHSAKVEIESYIKRFSDYYAKNLPSIAPTKIVNKDKPCHLESFLHLLGQEKCIQVIGPSGTGKSHLIKHVAIQSIKQGYVPVFIPSKYFTGQIYDLLDRSVAPLYPENALSLIESISTAGRQPILIFDGINECPYQQMDTLIDGIQALALRGSYIFSLTSQEEIKLSTELTGPIIKLQYLSDFEKREVASAYIGEPNLFITELLNVLKTPFEISLAVECLSEIKDSITKYELFNAYARKRLSIGEDSELAFRILVKIAQLLTERFSSALLLSEFKRTAALITESVNARPDAMVTALESGILNLQSGYCAFSHELLQRFFEAEALLSKCSTTADFIAEMEKPRNFYLSDFVLGSQTDIENVKKLIQSPAYYNLLAACINGQYGKYAKAAACSEALKVLQKATEEISNISFSLAGEKDFFINFLSETTWSVYEHALMSAIGSAFTKGFFVEQVLEILLLTEKRCLKFIDSSSDDDNVKMRLTNKFYQSLLVTQSSDMLTISRIIKGIASDIWEQRKNFEELDRKIKPLFIDIANQPTSILFLLCKIIHYYKFPFFISELPSFLNLCWDTRIGSLRLEVLNAIHGLSHDINEPIRSELIKLINGLDWGGNIFLSTMILEVLSSFDALETNLTVESAEDEIFRLLKNPVDEHTYEAAYGIYSNQFEDVFQGVYFEAVDRLNRKDKLKFLIMAGLGAPEYSFSSGYILSDLLKLNHPDAVPVFERWAEIPSEPTFIQGIVGAFIFALIGLAQYKDYPPIIHRPLKDDEAAWQAYREIVFWLYKPSITKEIVRKNCEPCWQRLDQLYIHASVDPLMHICNAIRGYRGQENFYKDLIAFFSSEITKILEAAIDLTTELTSVFGNDKWFKKDHGKFIVQTLEEVGVETTIPFLEKIIDSPELGDLAGKAIRSIRDRIKI